MKQEQEVDNHFLETIQANEGIIYKVASFYASTENPIVDLYQEIVLNIWKAFPSFREESKYSTWIYRIALNTCISFFRRKRISVNYIDIPLEIPDHDEANDDIQELYKLINRLGKIEKALVLLYLEDKSYKEIAEITGLTVTNVATRLNRTKQKLKQMSEQE